MFTGLVEKTATVVSITLKAGSSGTSILLKVVLPKLSTEDSLVSVNHGDSIAVDGCCLTVVDSLKKTDSLSLSFELSSETLSLTNFTALKPGDLVHVEQAMRLSDRLGGHLVSGHIDGLGLVQNFAKNELGFVKMTIVLPKSMSRWLVKKGSICISGVSLTINDLLTHDSAPLVELCLIPETLQRTKLGSLRVGDSVHVECDLIGKHVDRLMLCWQNEADHA
ncbi:MAG: riboflavin synthase [Oligoflexales bacterium]|nr:riboflavin synthase [Oligoflexales bacterium]